MKLLKIPSPVSLVEFAHVAPETIQGRQIVPMQLFQYHGRTANAANRIFVVSGFQGPSKNDVHVSGLFQKALVKGVFAPLSDVFVTPVVNPSSESKNSWSNHRGVDLRETWDPTALPQETSTLKRWIEFTKPKAVIHLTLGTPGIHITGVPASVSQRLADLVEKPVLEDGSTGTIQGLRSWCSEQGFIWVELAMDDTKKSFDEVRDGDWKKYIGPALKWLVEGERFDPPKEESLNLEHLVVPSLEMPPEFAHL